MRRQIEKRGFTLVEIIVVLVVLAILAALLLPSMIGWIDDAQAKKCFSELGSIRRSYLAEAAQFAYVVSDPAPLMEEAAEEWGGEYLGGGKINCPCGNPGVVVFMPDNASLSAIRCAIHSSGHGTLITDAFSRVWGEQWPNNKYVATLTAKSIHGYFSNRAVNTTIDSAGGVFAPLVKDQLKTLGVDADNMTWCIKKVANGEFEVYWMDGSVTLEQFNAAAPDSTYGCSKVTLTMDRSGHTTNTSETETGTIALKKKKAQQRTVDETTGKVTDKNVDIVVFDVGDDTDPNTFTSAPPAGP